MYVCSDPAVEQVKQKCPFARAILSVAKTPRHSAKVVDAVKEAASKFSPMANGKILLHCTRHSATAACMEYT